MSDALAHLDAAIAAMTLEAYRGSDLDNMSPVEHFTIGEDLKRIDSQIGPKGESIFARIADSIQEAYVELLAARTIIAAGPPPKPQTIDPALVGIAEEMKESGGHWQPCTGCYDTEDGHPTQKYDFSPALQTAIGCGCHECGGLGAVWWHMTDAEIASYAEDMDAIDDDAIDAIQRLMDKKGLKRKDLFPAKSRASECMSRKRPLSIAMIRKLHFEHGIRAEVLIAPYRAAPEADHA